MKGSFTVQMDKILDQYELKVDRAVNETMREVAKETSQRLRNTSPRGRRGKYAKGWKTTERKNGVVVHNTEYRLTHLLENGHVVRNQYGTYGRTRAIKHIEPAEQWANTEVENVIRRKLES